jgi:hypothetical protein
VRAERRERRSAAGLAAALAVGLSLAGAAEAGAQTGPSTSVVPSTFFGVAPQNLLTGGEVERMAQGRVGTLRILLSWSTVDATSADDNDWSQIDAIVGDAARNGITVLPFVFGTPQWVVNGPDQRACTQPACGLFAPRSPAALAQWQRFLREAVQRYGPNGRFFAENPSVPAVPIRTWQLWNEQNSHSFYKPKVDANAYANLVKAGSDAIRSVDPTARILLGGMFGAPEGEDNPKVFAWTYLRKLYRVPGFASYFDGVGVHPYAARMPKVIEQAKLMHKEMVRAHDPAEMWITEVGWSSGTGGNPLERGKRGQATRLREVMTYFIGRQAALNIQNVTWFAWRDLGGKPICEWCANAGLFGAAALTPKPSWNALMAYTGGS